MGTFSILIMVFLALVFVILGVLIKYFECYWLIAGYNTSSKKDKMNTDIVGLSRFIGNFCFVLAIPFVLVAVLNWYGISWSFYITLGAPFIIATCMVIGAQKYSRSTNQKSNKWTVVTIICIGTIILISVLALNISGAREPQVYIDPQKISISGMYGTEISMTNVKDVYIKDTIPEVKSKIYGFNSGNNLKGDFLLAGTGNTKLYVDYVKKPYLYIESNTGIIIINFNDSEKTKKLYNDITSFRCEL